MALQVLIFKNWCQNWEDFAELFAVLKWGLSVDGFLFGGNNITVDKDQ